MSSMKKYNDRWACHRNVAGHQVFLYGRKVAGFYVVEASARGTDLEVEAAGETLKIATDRALRMAGERL